MSKQPALQRPTPEQVRALAQALVKLTEAAGRLLDGRTWDEVPTP